MCAATPAVFMPSAAPTPYTVVTTLPCFERQRNGWSAITCPPPNRPPSRSMPAGSAVMIGSVDSGQSIVRPTTTAS